MVIYYIYFIPPPTLPPTHIHTHSQNTHSSPPTRHSTLSDLGNTSVYLTTTDPLTRSSLDVFRFAPTNTTGWVGYTHNSTTRSTSPTLQVRPGVDFDVADVALASSAAVPALLPVRLVSKPGGNASNQINVGVVGCGGGLRWVVERMFSIEVDA